VATAIKPRTGVPNGVLGMSLVLMAESMFFCGLISAFMVARSSAIQWPPPGQPRLPVEQTAFNSLILLASAYTMGAALRARAPGLRRWLLATLGLGAAFVALQGHEWVRLVGFGLTGRSSVYGGFFYLIVGAHALHVAAGLAALGAAVAGWVPRSSLRVVSMYWFFVVALWPILYVLVYL